MKVEDFQIGSCFFYLQRTMCVIEHNFADPVAGSPAWIGCHYVDDDGRVYTVNFTEDAFEFIAGRIERYKSEAICNAHEG